jgi:hypothetical protein
MLPMVIDAVNSRFWLDFARGHSLLDEVLADLSGYCTGNVDENTSLGSGRTLANFALFS